VRFITSRLLALAEPIIILAMGLMVGLVVVTMLSTIFTLSQGGQS
jgi:type II secretory pathway component PulF